MSASLSRTVAVFAGVLALVSGCAPTATEPPPEKKVGLVSFPESLAFTCVSPGCDTTLKVRVTVEGSRRVAIKRAILSDETKTEFSFKMDRATPFVSGAGTDFEIDVRYAPNGAPSPGRIDLVLSYTDASPTEGEEGRLPPGELVIPLVRRLVGEPALIATPSKFNYGAVDAGTEKTLTTYLVNGGFGNIALEIASVDGGDKDVAVELPAVRTLAPDAGTELSVSFRPSGERYLKTQVSVSPTASDIAPALIDVEGTSLPTPTLGLEPATEVELGELPLKQKRSVSRQLVNQGGRPLTITGVTVQNGGSNVTASIEGGKTSVTLQPLERATLQIAAEGKVAGPINATVLIQSNDAKTPSRALVVRGLITEPRLTLTPPTLDFATVPVGWVVSKPVELRNTGYGALTIKNITLVAGSSNLFTLRNLPSLPFVLERDQRVALVVEFRVETSATFAGSFSVETDDPLSNFSVVQLKAIGGSCAASCAIANGTPSCGKGVCEVASCNAGYFDTDKRANTGCECKEIDTDPGAFCESSRYVGVLEDTAKARASVSGVIPVDGDVDLIRFYARDSFSIFSDNFDTTVQLSSGDPSIKMCVYVYPAGDHDNQCFLVNELCPADGKFRKQGGGAGDDGADIVVKVFRAPNTAPTCTAYTLFLANGN